MARIHPSFPIHHPLGAGAYRERDILQRLEEGLPDSFDVFHNLPWSAMHNGQQGFGEYDFVIVSPAGQMMILEIKAGQVMDNQNRLNKHYGHDVKDIGQQMRRLHASLLERIKHGDLPQTQVTALLVLPDVLVHSPIVAYPRERIVDAGQLEHLCSLIRGSMGVATLPDDQRQRIVDYLSNRFEVQPDVATHIGQVQQASTQLASGLATWVPRIRHDGQVYQIEATAGSGKTQLSLTLLRRAAEAGKKARYVCYNRPLADHLARLAPPQCEVSTFHQLCRDHAEQLGQVPDFSESKVFEKLTNQYLQDAPTLPARLGLLILDESQDLDPTWVNALTQSLLPDGQLYVMGDIQQQLYDRESFELPGAVSIHCMDNFRSPQRVVDTINRLRLVPDKIQSRSLLPGETPQFHVWQSEKSSAAGQLESCLQQLWQEGYKPEQVAVISWRGHQQSQVLRQANLAGHATRRFTGLYDSAGNAVWSTGPLLVESIYRFKGQSAPAVVLCEVDFKELGALEMRKLFVGLTRAQMRVEVVLSESAAEALSARL